MGSHRIIRNRPASAREITLLVMINLDSFQLEMAQLLPLQTSDHHPLGLWLRFVQF